MGGLTPLKQAHQQGTPAPKANEVTPAQQGSSRLRLHAEGSLGWDRGIPYFGIRCPASNGFRLM